MENEHAEPGGNDLDGFTFPRQAGKRLGKIETRIMLPYLDLSKPDHSYLFGFLQGDGHLYRNKSRPGKGCLSVELMASDRLLLEKFQAMFPFYSSVLLRVRNTNFRDSYEAVTWSVSHRSFREELERLGLPVGPKSFLIKPPEVPYSAADYMRGLIDADGSLGIEKHGFPFLSLTTASDAIAYAYMSFLFSVTGRRKRQGKNQRDQVYNILIFKEDAQAVVKALYYDGCLALPRKAERVSDILSWQRPVTMRRFGSRQGWTSEQDAYLLSHTLQEAMKEFGRNFNSVKIRRGRLRRAANKVKLITD